MVQREEALNVTLARLLTDRGIASQAETLAGRRGEAPDILANVANEIIVIEAKKLADDRNITRNRAAAEAGAQAAKRIASGAADSGVALAYPDGITSDTLAERDDLSWWSVTPRAGQVDTDDPHIGPEARGNVDMLARWLLSAPAGDVDHAAGLLLGALSEAANRLDDSAKARLCKTLGLPSSKPAHLQAGTMRGFLTVAAATMFHRRLTPHLATVDAPDGSASSHDGEGWPPVDPFHAARNADPVGLLRDAWAQIILIDYRPVFEAAIAVMDAMAPVGQEFTAATSAVVRAADSISRTAAAARHDLLGKIFHRVLDTARYDGSFYTSSAAATLLAALALRPGQIDWSDPDSVAALRVCDPACGSGTLLMAVAERAHDLMADASDADDREDRYLVSASLIENVIWGYDINLTACHLAATTLGLLAPSVAFDRMNIFRAPLGISSESDSTGSVRLGSLDLLRPVIEDHNVQVAFPGFLPDTAVHIDDTDRAGDPPPMDLVIMNPPFTRDSLRHDQFNRREEMRVKDTEKRLFDRHPDRAAARLHSSDGPFLLLGEHLASEDDGVIALVLPAGVATSPGALGRRKFLAEKFHIDTVVLAHDPKRWFFSENTAIQEMLIIGRRRRSDHEDLPTRFVNLTRNPSNPADATVLAEMISQADTRNDRFTVHFEDARTVAAGDWRATAFLSPHLLESFRSLAQACATLRDIADVGPEGRRIRDAFVRRDLSKCRHPRDIMWDHKASTRTTMSAETDVWADMRPHKKALAESYWAQRSRLLLANRLRLNTMRVLAVRAEWPTVGSAWVPVRPSDASETTEKALCAWFNSTLGLLGAYGRRTLKAFSYPRFALEDQRSFPTPLLDEAQAAALADAYDRLAEQTLAPLPAMNNCKTRSSLDDVVTAVLGDSLGVDREEVRRLRSLLAAEPAVSSKQAF